jgi:addiction module HigA family antidote
MSIHRPAAGWKINGVTTRPGEILEEEFLKPLSISQNRLALDIRVPATRISQIIQGKRGITPDTALRLAKYFGNSAEFWLNLQQMHDLSKARQRAGNKIDQEVHSARRIA